MPDLSFELLHSGPVCGVDEAGRGPWAGPVSAAAVILDPNDIPEGLNDSKLLTEKARDRLAPIIKDKAITWAIAFASVQEIDEINILQATGLAMRRAVDALSLAPIHALIYGNRAFTMPCPVTTLVKGDSRSLSIAAASILAKTARDELMIAADLDHPGYGFAKHKGYHSKLHVEALTRLGPCPIHRLSFKPVREALLNRGK